MVDICKAGDPVRWKTLYKLMADIMDNSSGEYSFGNEENPVYNKILDETSPFYLPDVYRAEPALHIGLREGLVVVTYLVQTVGDTTPWVLPNPLKTLASQGRLYFMAEPDDCFCKTIWRVQDMGGYYTLAETGASAKMACQSMEVPTPGSIMPNAFVPNAAWSRMLRRAGDSSDSDGQTWTEKKCMAVDGLLYKTDNNDVMWVQRSMIGHFTWSIAKDDFDQIFLAMTRVFIEWPCGYERSKWWHYYDSNNTPGAGQMREEDEALPLSADNWQYVWAWTAKLLASTDSAWAAAVKPGCLEVGLEPYVNLKLPWYESTCGDNKRCPDQPDKLLVRCTTLRILDALVRRLKQTGVRAGCYATLRYNSSYQQGFAQACALGTTPDGDGYYTVSTTTNLCTRDGVTYQNCDIVTTESGGVRQWGGIDPSPPLSQCLSTTDDGCSGVLSCSTDPADTTVTHSGYGSAGALLSTAKTAAQSAGWVDGTPATSTMSLGNGTVDGLSFWGGAPFVVGTGSFFTLRSGSSASYFSYRLLLEAVDLPPGHVFRVRVKQQRTAYDEFGNPTTETLAINTHYIYPGGSYTEEVPPEDGVYLTAEIWHDKAPS